MSDTLYWDDLHLGSCLIPSSQVAFGEYVRLIMDFPHQHACMQHMFTPGEQFRKSAWKMWLDTDDGRFEVGSPGFCAHIGSMIRQHGLIANLTLKENLLLPFLYRGDDEQLAQATDELELIAETLGIAASLHERAGERSSFTHALISLGRCLLMKPMIIVAQEVHIGMSPEHLERFRALSMEALQELGAGLLYLTASPDEGSGLNFARTLTIGPDKKTMSGMEG